MSHLDWRRARPQRATFCIRDEELSGKISPARSPHTDELARRADSALRKWLAERQQPLARGSLRRARR